MFCSKCGTQLDDDARFCSKCGAPVAAVDAVPVGNPAVSLDKPNNADKAAVSLDKPNNAVEEAASLNNPNNAVETAVLTDSVKKKVGLLKFLPIVVAAAVVVIIAIIAIVGLTALGSPKLCYKPVLKTALAQMNNYPSTTVLEENKKLVQEAIDNPDVSY